MAKIFLKDLTKLDDRYGVRNVGFCKHCDDGRSSRINHTNTGLDSIAYEAYIYY